MIPYIYVDEGYFGVIDGEKYVTNDFLIITGIRDDGFREIFGVAILMDIDEEWLIGREYSSMVGE